MPCWNSPRYAPVETNVDGNGEPLIKKPTNDYSVYPGARRQMKAQFDYNQRSSPSSGNNEKNLVQTGGNAFMEYDPATMSDLVKVTVPEGCYAGQVIQVSSPDGSGRVTHAVIPRGCSVGSTFMIKFPPPGEEVNGGIGGDGIITNYNNAAPGVGNDLLLTTEEPAAAANTSAMNSTAGGEQTRTPSSQMQQQQPPPMMQNNQNNANSIANNFNTNTDNNQELTMIVSVPPGVAAGSTMYARLPPAKDHHYNTADRVLPVTVPMGGVSQFQVSYSMNHTIPSSDVERHHSQQAGEQ